MIPSNRICILHPCRLLAFLRVTVAVAAGILVSGGAASAQSRLDVLHAFAAQASMPASALIHATDGNFYGTTRRGGDVSCHVDPSGCGTVFTMTPSGTVTVLHAFTGGADGAFPGAALIQATDGNFYGTTTYGGGGACFLNHVPVDCGTVFRMTPAGTVTILHAFTYWMDGTDGAFPGAALIQATDGNFYGTTASGGGGSCEVYLHITVGCGTVFRMTPAGTVTILHAFTGGADGSGPSASLIQATDGNFYGTTSGGTIFTMTPSGTVTVLHTFTGGADGAFPEAALIQATDGNFYGTTEGGGGISCLGGTGCGTVFKMTPGGTVTLLHSFTGGATDGASPHAALIQSIDGNFYGTTANGGGISCLGGTTGCGTVFRMTPSGTVTILHTFTGGTTDGAFPYAALIQTADGNFYGTTQEGGTVSGTTASGTVFQMTSSGTVTVLHVFTYGTDGALPYAALIQATDGNFYGTTTGGGTSGSGTVFTMTPSGTLTILHAFTGTPDGDGPHAALIQATDGNFYGTTAGGGTSTYGTVFKMTPSGTLTTLHAFTGGTTDGAFPYAQLIQATDGNFYGTTLTNGTGNGTVFKMTPNGTLTILHAFTGTTDGGAPFAALIQATDGNFYGTTRYGGTAGSGTVFKMTPSGSVTILHAFTGGTTDGAFPDAALIQTTDGNFYGTTAYGGTSADLGTVFKMTPSGTVTILHAFTGGTTDGASPSAALIQGADGNFYGTTSSGGTSGNGTVFTVTPSGTLIIRYA